MSRTYKATGINLKSLPMGESDRLLTILTREHGLVRAVAMGSRKHHSSLSGRSGLFVVNHLLVAKGRSLDKIAQAETVESYPGLSRDLKKLTAGQYIAELCLFQALSEQPQEELFVFLNQHLKQLELCPVQAVLPLLTLTIFRLLALEGIAPEVRVCCVTRQPLVPDRADPHWKAGFSVTSGGAITLEVLQELQQHHPVPTPRSQYPSPKPHGTHPTSPSTHQRVTGPKQQHLTLPRKSALHLHYPITATELRLLQAIADLAATTRSDLETSLDSNALDILTAQTHPWLSVERILRQYAQYHFEHPIRSAALMDACFS